MVFDIVILKYLTLESVFSKVLFKVYLQSYNQ